MTTILFPRDIRLQHLRIENILRVEAHSNYSKFYFSNQEPPLVVSKVLQWVQDRLPPELFARVHRSHLVNKRHLMAIDISNKSLVLSNGDRVAMSRRRATFELKSHLCSLHN